MILWNVKNYTQQKNDISQKTWAFQFTQSLALKKYYAQPASPPSKPKP